ncbi:hypothetical protein [Afifella aestuarii]|uniref:hypothetical protein n=1 Tax=Afifella aestuarii TaxID=1909496 RepID=UPI000FE43DC0|nr:hypothetical protein [Afifella aestuarii]
MANHQHMVLARQGLKIPMPDRDFRLFPAKGRRVDLDDPFYAQLKRGGDLVASEPIADGASEPGADSPESATPGSQPEPETTDKPQGAKPRRRKE